jgi:hypothetical protein
VDAIVKPPRRSNCLRNRWSQAAKSNKSIEAQQEFMRYTVDVTTNLAFDYEVNTLQTEGDINQERLEKICRDQCRVEAGRDCTTYGAENCILWRLA